MCYYCAEYYTHNMRDDDENGYTYIVYFLLKNIIMHKKKVKKYYMLLFREALETRIVPCWPIYSSP